MKRVAALFGKELTDLRLNPSVFLPVALIGLFSVALPFAIVIGVPAATGEALSDSRDLASALELYLQQPGARALDPDAAIQAWLFQQFLMFLVIVPVMASSSIAGHSVIGEKQARTLEPLLATPITTLELLAAKSLAALLPSVALTLIGFVVYLGLIAVFARPGVAGALLGPQSLSVVFLLAPLAVLAALQGTVCVSSRARDARSAQQLGALIALPIVSMFIAPFLGAPMTTPMVVGAAVGLLMLNGILLRIGITVFDRERILTQWK